MEATLQNQSQKAGSRETVPADWQRVDFLTVKSAAAIAGGLSSGALYKAEADGKLSFVRLAGRTMVTTESLKRFIGSAQPWVKSDRGKEARAKRSERAKVAWQG